MDGVKWLCWCFVRGKAGGLALGAVGVSTCPVSTHLPLQLRYQLRFHGSSTCPPPLGCPVPDSCLCVHLLRATGMYMSFFYLAPVRPHSHRTPLPPCGAAPFFYCQKVGIGAAPHGGAGVSVLVPAVCVHLLSVGVCLSASAIRVSD
jgi:hypothetical protein